MPHPNYYRYFFQCYNEGRPPQTNQISPNLKVCQSIYDYCIVNEKFQANCSNIPFENYNYQFENSNQYLKSCNESLIYTTNEIESYLFHNICFVICPENTLKNEEKGICECKSIKYKDINNDSICYNEEEISNGKIYTDNGECPENSIYDDNNYCKCLYFHYLNSFTRQIQCALDNEYCPIEYPYINISSNQCINDCSHDELLSGAIEINNIFASLNNITDNIKNIIYDEKYNGENLIIKGKNIIYEIFSLKNQSYHENISFLNLGECEKILLEKYKIEDLYIVKTDIRINDTDPTKVEYQILDPENKNQLNLSDCGNEKIILELPSYFNEEIINNFLELFGFNYDLFDKNGRFYNDICTPFSSNDKTDLILSDRRKIYYKESFNLCEKNCNYLSFNKETRRINCECPVKTKISEETEIIKFDKDNLTSFFSIKTYANFAVLKCYKLVFSKEGETNNYGSYLFIILIIIYIVVMIIFYYKYELKIRKVLFLALNPILNKESETKVEKPIINDPNNIKKNIVNSTDKQANQLPKYENNLEKKKTSAIKIYKNNKEEMNDSKSQKSEINISKESKNHLLKFPSLDYLFKEDLNYNEIKLEVKNYNDEELNSLLYEKALEIDKRAFWQYYFSLIERKNLIIFTFYVKNDFNILFIKILLFLFSFSLYFAINTLFFKDEAIHKIFEVKGKFDFIFHLPQIFYSTIISVAFNKIMKLLSLSEDELIKIRGKKIIKIFMKIHISFIVA